MRLTMHLGSLAVLLGKYGRSDLQNVVIARALKYGQARQFQPLSGAMMEVSRLLSFAPAECQADIPGFLIRVCTDDWLRFQFRNEKCERLAGALIAIAIHQPPEIVSHFRSEELASRLLREFSKLRQVNQTKFRNAILLLGAAQLCGVICPKKLTENVPWDKLDWLLRGTFNSRLPLPYVTPNQMAAWFGVRVIVTLASRIVGGVDESVLKGTLELWRENLRFDAHDPQSTKYRINQSMVSWLEKCVARRPAVLLTMGEEPLWVLAGFPNNPLEIQASRNVTQRSETATQNQGPA
jgi:hypothetical protein